MYTGPNHPYGANLWPIPALGIGYGETKIVETYDFINAIVNGQEADPSFRDGYQIELIADAIVKSAAAEAWTNVQKVDS